MLGDQTNNSMSNKGATFATSFPTLPRPMMPSFFPSNPTPILVCHIPSLNFLSSSAILLVKLNISPQVNSAVEWPGLAVLQMVIPNLVAASMSILDCLPPVAAIRRKFVSFSRVDLVNQVLSRIVTNISKGKSLLIKSPFIKKDTKTIQLK